MPLLVHAASWGTAVTPRVAESWDWRWVRRPIARVFDIARLFDVLRAAVRRVFPWR